MRCCIAVLTRGYSELNDYRTLIERNRAIRTHLEDRSVPLVFFHEGNITPDQQMYIAEQTPELTLQFVDIKAGGQAFRAEKQQETPVLTIDGFGWGYRHMCSFWFVDLWHFVADYDLLIRIDEDCNMESSLDRVLNDLRTAPEPVALCSGLEMDDADFVVVGLNDFTRAFMRDETGEADVPEKNPSRGPYTNFMGMRLDRLRGHDRLARYVQAVDCSNHIYHHRWGDLPLWGEAVTYMLGKDALNVDNRIQYYHGTHSSHVNANV